MENVRSILGMLGWIFGILTVYIHMGKYHFRYLLKYLKNFNWLINLSVIFSAGSLILGKLIYNKYDWLLLLPIIINVIPFVENIVNFVKNKSIKKIIININKNYCYLTKDEKLKYKDLKNYKELMLVNQNNTNYIIAFDTSAPQLNQSGLLVVEKHEENNTEFYLCTRIIYNQQPMKEFLSLLFNMYIIAISTYGQYLVSKLSLLNNGSLKNDDTILSFLVIPFSYALFATMLNVDVDMKTGFQKFLYYIFLIFKYILMIELLFILFI